MNLEGLAARITDRGLAFRGAFHPEIEDDVPALPRGPAATLVLLGFVGRDNWPTFRASSEARDGQSDPLDRWSKRVVDGLAAELDVIALYPFGGPPWLPFVRWALKAESVHPSPIGILIHPDWGLWHGYRGALAFADRFDLGPRDIRASPCVSCAAKPCLSSCPAGALTPGHFDVAKCISHAASAAGHDCAGFGCEARRACPVGVRHRHGPDQAQFHIGSFLKSATTMVAS